MAEVTDLHILAKMAEGSADKEDALTIRDKNKVKKVLYRIHNLRELVEVLSTIPPKILFPYLYRIDKKDKEFECDIALWVHYVLGDAILSAKILHFVEQFHNNPERLKLEIFNLCFNRYLNFLEVTQFSGESLPLENEPVPPTDI